MDFHIGSGLAGAHQVGNEAEDLHFYGGRYGILTEKPSPAWQFTLIDSSIRGPARGGHSRARGRPHAHPRHLPQCADRHRYRSAYSDELWVKDCRFENISGAAVIISNEKSPLTEIGFENAVLKDVPIFALFRESGKTVAGKGPSIESRISTTGSSCPAKA